MEVKFMLSFNYENVTILERYFVLIHKWTGSCPVRRHVSSRLIVTLVVVRWALRREPVGNATAHARILRRAFRHDDGTGAHPAGLPYRHRVDQPACQLGHHLLQCLAYGPRTGLHVEPAKLVQAMLVSASRWICSRSPA